MNINISGHHLEITPAIKEYVESKIGRVLKHFDHVIDAQVILSLEPLKHIAEITLRVPGKDIHCAAEEENLYAAIDLLSDKADRLVIKHKSKLQDHSNDSTKRMTIA
ncbi:MAG: ribosome-associated translation inhibitor RaiA [Advenella sp.]